MPNRSQQFPRGLPLREMLLARARPTDGGCWQWLSQKNHKGYGCLHRDDGIYQAHRLSYSVFRGPIPDGLLIDHLCRNHGCINPWHLEPVTPRENARRGISPAAINIHKTHCIRGHALEGANLLSWKLPLRVCKICDRARQKVYSKRYKLKKRRGTA